MNNKPKNKFTVKIILSYAVLAFLAAVSGYFIYTEIRTYTSSETALENDIKLLKTGAFLTELYEAEGLSKLALQTKTRTNFTSYTQKIDSIFLQIDTLKQLTSSANQKTLLDSVQTLLNQKVANSKDLISLKVNTDPNRSIDKALEEFKKMQASYGKLTIENFEKNPEQLTPYKRKVLADWVAYLNANIPADSAAVPDAKTIDSIIDASKSLLAQAKINNTKTQRSLTEKEIDLSRNDLELSKQLQTIISAFEQEVVVNTYNDNQKKQAALKRSIRLAGFAALLGLLIVSLFAFLINRDFWKIQTYRQKLEKEKKYSESLLKSREQLISTVSHDLRTPLNTIGGYTDLLENTDLNDKQLGYVKHVKSASGYVGNLVNDLLDFSKLDAGKLNIEQVPFVAAHLIQETAENIEALYRDKKLKLHLEIDSQLDKPVLGDPFRIRQVLSNLIGNAFKFTEEGFVKIKANGKSGKGNALELKITIADTGIGIASDKQELIFKEFTQAETDTEKRFGGYGLGLTISKKLAELLHGSLELTSKVNEGSTFTLTLPLKLSEKPVRQKEKEAPYMAKKLRLLIIDDDTSLLQMLKELAESMGIVAHTFTNFLKVEHDSHLDYDLVLTDIQMPQVTGFEVLDKLKSGLYSHYKSQPVIAMTGRRDLEPEAYISIGFDQVLQKPFSKGELVAALKLLGVNTEQKVLQEQPARRINHESDIYNLDIIHSFLGTNEDAIFDVLQTFLRDTRTNMELLKEGIAIGDYAHINQVAHRMLPMFRQLKVNSCVPILETMELAKKQTLGDHALQQLHKKLIRHVDVLIAALATRLATSPSYSD
ncbi:ATP-binding protein [Maribacter sp. 2307UL18-2]|uniref:hybrid sensor histidine kinase/response regulator n=1 Tax=Maribacter sp. 2307UL18-2 TaxID=3386274 RepID=UPI0039BD6631